MEEENMYLDLATMDTYPAVNGLEREKKLYPLFYGKEEIEKHIAETLPWRIWYRRGAHSTPIRSHPHVLLDKAEYGKAKDAHLFDIFDVVTPTYGRVDQRGSWIVGRVRCTSWWAMIAPVTE